MMTVAHSDIAPAPRPMLHALAKAWWLVLLRGIAAIVFGVLAFVWPGLTLITLVLFYGAYALIDGVCALAAAFTGAPSRCRHGGSSSWASWGFWPASSPSCGPASPPWC
ncbi:MAG: HdeD family acid-resistance protein [Xanthobacteraceae bacterium]